jgi:hypothetical protein
MPVVLAALGNQPLEKVAQVERHIRVGIFLNEQRTGGVLDK